MYEFVRFGADPPQTSGTSEFKCAFIRGLLGPVEGKHSTQCHSTYSWFLPFDSNLSSRFQHNPAK